MNNAITANDLKTKGISIVDKFTKEGLETFITVRGEQKYVVITTAEFNRLRECELISALNESEDDIKNGRYKTSSIGAHLKRIRHA